MSAKELRESIARTIWVTAWAEYEERENDSASFGPGVALFDVAPPTPPDAYEVADRFISELHRRNKLGLYEIYAAFSLRLIRAEEDEISEDTFGYLLVMEAEGQGVGLWEHLEKHGIAIPSLENLQAWHDKKAFRLDGPSYSQVQE